ncbi:glycosyltransferase family 4 protein [Sphingomonas sp. KRR8]|uniref:glycosyltransferase family 4 protein n=1 Tax=Sphingomonas sp. KRR8 TaxID=2942996 RepID=UPI00201FE653|nr:glycosyltransferase family 4 protein [Sphingomonas sp. KRR8]URD61624.1 glycosyltransferase family 4 protein [Sphingomonas sp. KRR8]
MTTPPPGREQACIAYLTSQYPASSHTFIRREVSALRELGVHLETFSIRAPSAAELRAEEDRSEESRTYTLLRQGPASYLKGHLAEVLRSPGRYFGNLAFALRHRAPGVRNGLLALAHFVEAMLLAGELRRRGIAHLHNHFANSAATVGLLASRQAKIGWSFTIHGISEFDYPAGLTLSEKIDAAAFVACVSYFGRAQAERLIPPEVWPKLKIVRCGLELDRLPKVSTDAGPSVKIIAVGRLSAEKGFAGLIDAFSRLPAERLAQVDLVGDGPLKEALEAQVARLGLSDRVRFLGRLPEAETLEAIAASDMLVLSSFMEGLPIVLMEALALGKPVIASRVAGIPELVREGETGLLFAPSDWDELATALDRLVGDPEARQSMGRRGPEVISSEFDIRKSAMALRDLFLAHAPSGSSSAERPS